MISKIRILFYFVIFNVLLFSCTTSNNMYPRESEGTKIEELKLSKPYFGQKPPGMVPEVFAPGIISTGLSEAKICFSADGNEVYFNTWLLKPFDQNFLFYSHNRKGYWIEPKEIFYPDKREDFGRVFLSPDGEKLLFQSRRTDEESKDHPTQLSIWYMDRIENGWGNPRRIHWGSEFPYRCSHPSISSNGNLYFQARLSDQDDADIFMAEYIDGKYKIPVKLSENVNSHVHDCHPYIAPDESYLIFDANRPEDGFGNMDLYISFRSPGGKWDKAINMGIKVNSAADERRAFVTFDSMYLFFLLSSQEQNNLPENPLTLEDLVKFNNSENNGSRNIYWMNAGIIEELREEYKVSHK